MEDNMHTKLTALRLLIALLFLFLFYSNSVYCSYQLPGPGEEDYAIVVDKAPSPVGGFETIVKKIVYPSMAVRAGVEGKVYLLIFTSVSGDVDDVKIVKGIGAGCDEESERVIRKTKFTPGVVNGNPVKTKFTLALTFKIPK
jgi:periplasmic protein TonB